MNYFFAYGEQEIAYLKSRDKRLGEVIDKVGMVKRRVIPNLFAALVHSILGQQISTKTHETIWRKVTSTFGEVTPEKVLSLSPEELQAFGITFKKENYIRSAARKIASGEFDIHALRMMSDAEVCAKLSELDSVGVWTAEMLTLHSLQRPDVLSLGDLGCNAVCGCCIITAKLPTPCSRNTAAVILLTAMLPVFIYGWCRQVRWRV